jgi:hypothetical protein
MTWKRIQTLLIAIATLLLLATMFGNMCHSRLLLPGDEAYAIRFTERLQYLLLSIVILLLCVAGLFGYKQPMAQASICLLAAILLFAYQALIVYAFFQLRSEYVFTIFSVFPVVSAILLLVARRYCMREAAKAVVDKIFKK